VKRRAGEPPDRSDDLLAIGTTDHYVDTALYDFEYADRVEDIRWYRTLARDRGDGLDILELGAGTGRISCPLAADGHRVIALDSMPTMLEALGERARDEGVAEFIRPLHADMRELPIESNSVEIVIAPFNALMHLYDWHSLLRCFREVERVLVPGGAFAFDVQIPDLEWLRWDPEARHAITRFVHPKTGEKLVYSTNHTYDQETQICHIRIYYDEAPPSGRRFAPPAKPKRLVHLAHRQIFPEEVRMLVATAGLTLLALNADFTDRALKDAKESQVAVCGKPRARPTPGR
jgi:ubiquinone/menaquinone biosynthesis C-methylase UbiE